MEDKKAPNGDDPKAKGEDGKQTFNEKAEEFAKAAREGAENFAEKTMEGVGKLLDDVFKKKGEGEAGGDETDPKDVEIQELKDELAELRDKYVRLYADFDNHRKRSAKDKLEIIQTAGKEVIMGLLPVLDDFERAQKALASSNDINTAKEGLNLIHQKLLNNLSAKGLKPMESIGKDFDVHLHEAVTEIPTTPDKAGKVLDELEKGYYLNDKIIRFAKVVVGKKS